MNSLKGHTHHLIVPDDRSSGIAGINGCIYLDGQVRINAGMGIGIELDSRNHPPGDGQALATDGITDCGDCRMEWGNAVKGESGDRLKEVLVIRHEDGQVAVMGYVLDLCRIQPGIPLTFEEDQPGITYHVGVGHNPVARNHKSGPKPASHLASLPGFLVVWSLNGGMNPDETFSDCLHLQVGIDR